MTSELDIALKQRLGALASAIDQRLNTVADTWDGPERLVEAMRYALFTGGKRIRPAMTLAACEAAGGEALAAVDEGIALELVHTYSLVHDDLPAMDDDTVRRGQPTVHVKFDEAIAILAGDALLTEAFTVLAARDVSAERRARACRVLADAAGQRGMVGGQIRDIEVPEPTEAALSRMHAEKTGALFVAACRLGAIAAGAAPDVEERLVTCGRAVGEAFQVSDDLLDLLELGDAGGEHEADVNLASIFGPHRALERVRADVATALKALDGMPGPADTLAMLARWIEERSIAAVATLEATL